MSQGWTDTEWVERFVDKLSDKYTGTTMIVPERRMGATKIAGERAEHQAFQLLEVPSLPQFGDYKQAVQAAHICRLADVIMVMWAGGADLGDKVIKKALQVHRPAPQFDPGLHVYEMTKTRATKSKKSQHTGKVKYRHREKATLIERKAA